MIPYDISEGDTYSRRVSLRPKTCFVMTKIGQPLPQCVINIRRTLTSCLKARGMKDIDAGIDVTGRDFLDKIWGLILSVPIGVAIVSEEMSSKTISNVYYELGLMQASGKETVIIKTPNMEVPSDFIRTEWIDYDNRLKQRLDKFFDKVAEQAEHYTIMAEGLEKNPFVSLDYLKRAYLITGNSEYKNKAIEILVNCSGLDSHTHGIVKDFLHI
jgi:hypothetical protein